MGADAEDDHDTEHFALLLNLVVMCLLLPASAHLSYFGVTNLFRSRNTQSSRNRFGDERKCLGWPYLKLLAVTALIMGFCFEVTAFYYICVSPAWMRGYHKSSPANVICKLNFALQIFFCCGAYSFFLAFWLERLIHTFKGAAAQTQISNRCAWFVRVPIVIVLAIAFVCVVFGMIFEKGSIDEVKSTDVNPFKHVNRHPTICQPFQSLAFLIVLGVVLIVLLNAYLGYAYFTRLRAIFSNGGSRMDAEQSYIRRVAIVALSSVASTFVCFVVELLVKPIGFFFAIDVVVNSLCIVASFKFGHKHYEHCFACFEFMWPSTETPVGRNRRVTSVTSEDIPE